MEIDKKILPQITAAMRDDDVEALAAIFTDHPEALKFEAEMIVTWLHWACRTSSRGVVKYLVESGLDPNKADTRTGLKPIVAAAQKGKNDIVEYLLSVGAEIDDETSLVNPLFAAIYATSDEIVQTLLENGANGHKRYSSDTMENMNAVAFALERGEQKIAQMIALHNADQDKEMARKILIESREIAEKNNA